MSTKATKADQSKFDIMLAEIRKSAKKSKDEYIKLLEEALLDVTDGVKDHEIESDYGLPEDDAFRCIAVRILAKEAHDARRFNHAFDTKTTKSVST